jgi:hypothetical protein
MRVFIQLYLRVLTVDESMVNELNGWIDTFLMDGWIYRY